MLSLVEHIGERRPATERSDGASTTHPHEPNVPPVIDGDGRCLVCAIDYAAGELAREVARRAAGLRQVGWLDPTKAPIDQHRILPVDAQVSETWLPVYVQVPDGC